MASAEFVPSGFATTSQRKRPRARPTSTYSTSHRGPDVRTEGTSSRDKISPLEDERGVEMQDNGQSSKEGISIKDYVDARADKTRAENDARFEAVISRLDTIQQTSASWRSVWGAAIATSVALAGLLIGIIAIEGDRFESGMAARETISSVIQPIVDGQRERDAEQDLALAKFLEEQELRDLEQLQRDAAQDEKLDRILNAVENLNVLSQGSAPEGPN